MFCIRNWLRSPRSNQGIILLILQVLADQTSHTFTRIFESQSKARDSRHSRTQNEKNVNGWNGWNGRPKYVNRSWRWYEVWTYFRLYLWHVAVCAYTITVHAHSPATDTAYIGLIGKSLLYSILRDLQKNKVESSSSHRLFRIEILSVWIRKFLSLYTVKIARYLHLNCGFEYHCYKTNIYIFAMCTIDLSRLLLPSKLFCLPLCSQG